jgi:uncharacterized protein YciI
MSQRTSLTLALGAVLLLGTPMPAATRSAPEAAYVVLLRLRWDLYARWKESGQWPADSAANAALAGHVAFWAKQRGEGGAILAGGMKGEYWDNVALIIFRAASEAEANALVQQDPAVRAHVFQAQVRGFDVHWIGAVALPKP